MKRQGLTAVLMMFLAFAIGRCGATQAPAQEGKEEIIMSADKISAGRLRGINVVGSAHMTKGTYLTAALSGGETTVPVKDTTDFPASGSGWFIDSTNDRDEFSWTGKTDSSLTGCSGVLAHNDKAVVVPQTKAIVIADNVNEMRFFGDRGDGTIEELASIGIKQVGGDIYIGYFGSSNSNRIGVRGKSDTSIGVLGESNAAQGVVGMSDSLYGVYGKSDTAYGVYGSSPYGYGGAFSTTSSGKGPIVLKPSSSASVPSHSAEKGTLWVTSNGVLYINTDGSTTWQKVGAQ